jgi:hypothetical protein
LWLLQEGSAESFRRCLLAEIHQHAQTKSLSRFGRKLVRFLKELFIEDKIVSAIARVVWKLCCCDQVLREDHPRRERFLDLVQYQIRRQR